MNTINEDELYCAECGRLCDNEELENEDDICGWCKYTSWTK